MAHSETEVLGREAVLERAGWTVRGIWRVVVERAGRGRREFFRKYNPAKADAAPSVPDLHEKVATGSSAAGLADFLKQNMVVVHEIAQCDGFKHSIKG